LGAFVGGFIGGFVGGTTSAVLIKNMNQKKGE
jgi:hypothetical protein